MRHVVDRAIPLVSTTGRLLSACMVTGVMNCAAAFGHHDLHRGAGLGQQPHSSADL